MGQPASSQRQDGTWDVYTYDPETSDHKGVIHAEHVVNAGGLWAREVGRMAGLELPVLAMEHHYLMTEPMDGGHLVQPGATAASSRT